MLVFGGRAGATLFNDVYVFDLGAQRRRLHECSRPAAAHALRCRLVCAETLVWAAQKCQGNLPSKRCVPVHQRGLRAATSDNPPS